MHTTVGVDNDQLIVGSGDKIGSGVGKKENPSPPP